MAAPAGYHASETFVAIKTFDNAKCAKEKIIAKARDRELQVLRMLRSEAGNETGHLHIANMIAEHQTAGTMFAVLEYCGGGSLQRLLQQQTARGIYGMPEARVAELTGQLSNALRYLHSFGVAHRDIKSGNVLFDGRELGEGRGKLCDFGFAITCNDKPLRQQCGTPNCFAPELTEIGEEVRDHVQRSHVTIPCNDHV